MTSCTSGGFTYHYQYDHLSRLTTYKRDATLIRNFHYDGWNRIAEFTNTTLVDTFTWGIDLSGTMQGAGGVGGLLATRWVSSGNLDYFPTCDGNGNVVQYLTTAGAVTTHYEYDPFGTLTRLTGNNSIRFQYRFSTKPRDFNTGLYYYGYRYYGPVTGRWPSRDPIEEQGGLLLYCFVGNDGVNKSDNLGQEANPFPSEPPPPPPPIPNTKGNNSRQLVDGYFFTSCCRRKPDRLKPIPGILSPSEKRPPIRTAGPAGGEYNIYPFPTSSSGPVGGGGAQPCIILVIKCKNLVAVFHFNTKDDPQRTLKNFTWPKDCRAMICGGDDTDQSNCLGDDVEEAVNDMGIKLDGVSGNSACGVSPDGNNGKWKWWQHGK
jgi:RHS repeat-associated protein